MKNFWDQQHKDNNIQFLTGSSGEGIWQDLAVRDRVRPGANVLNIGVGLGYCTKALVDQGCQVHAMDISSVALSKVKNIVDRVWEPTQYAEMPTDFFDLALSYLVTQHMSPDDLIEQLRYVVTSLAPHGIFAMQFASRLAKQDIQVTENNIKYGGICYTAAQLTTIVESVGGKILWLKHASVYPQHGSEWYFVHISRAAI